MRRLTLKQQIEQLRHDLAQEWESHKRTQGVLERVQKRYKALAHGITAVCPRDRAFMLRFHDTNDDPDLYDVYNGFLYAFGRTCEESGTVFTRLSCPWSLPENKEI